MSRIGLLGGSFNPIHQGHLAIANSALVALQLDGVWLIPNVHSPFKGEMTVTFEDRYAMCALAIQKQPMFQVLDIESHLPAPSYTIATIQLLQSQYPEHQFYFIIGDDQAVQLGKWKDIEDLAKLVVFAVVAREMEQVTCQYRHVVLPSFHHPASSTEIRRGDFRYLDEAVRQYIVKKELYLADIVASRMPEKTFRHTQSVRTLAMELGRIHQLDVHKLSIAAYFHDIAKFFPKEAMATAMALEPISHQQSHPAIHHQFVGARFVKEMLGIDDEDILVAIGNHTTGNDNPYTMVLFVADKIEPLRNYDVSEELALVKQDLVAGYRLVKEKQTQYLQTKNKENTA